MQPRHRVSRAAIDLIKRFEGYRRKAAELPDGRWTIGHGHTLTARQGAEVTPDDAEALLLYDLIAVAHAVNETVFSPLTQNQFDALASFVFSIGTDNFSRSGVLKRLNEGALIQAACAMELWRKAEVAGERIVIDALVRRRSVEKTLFLTPPGEAWVPAPSPVLKPLLDTDAHEIVPRDAPAAITTSMEGDTVVLTREDAPGPPVAPPENDTDGPAASAAEAVSARLSTIFQEPGEEPAPPSAEPALDEVEAPVHPENIPLDPQPQADFAAPAPLPPAEPEEPAFTLRSHADDDTDDDVIIGADEFDHSGDEQRSGRDLFDVPTPGAGLEPEPDRAAEPAANDPEDADEDLAFLSRLPESAPEDREPVDMGSDFDELAPAAQPLPVHPRGGLLTLLASAILGLAFFGGGVFWATNARPMTPSMWLDPRVVGWLAVAAGIGFFTVSAFLLLERLGEASERSARYRR